jgi:hypothetical protein
MAALYKLHGDPRWPSLWVARSVFRNNGNETLTDYRVRFRLAGYSEWSRWERADSVAPGQTVVDAFYPILDARVRDLKAPAPADVQVEYRYTRPGGERVTDTHSERIRILGINAGVFSSRKPDRDTTWRERYEDVGLVLASFTCPTDPVVLDVMGLVSRQAGGTGASLSDAGALRFLETLYNLYRTNISYETTHAGDFDGAFMQQLKYGREVLRTRSGTCVDLATLYASVAEAAGLQPYLVVIPGHALVGVRLPRSNRVVFVETTGCGGGSLASSKDFAWAIKAGKQALDRALKQGLFILVNIPEMRRKGVTTPELPDPGKTPLKEWGIHLPFVPSVLVEDRGPLPSTPAKPTPPSAESPIVGVWNVLLGGKGRQLTATGAFHGNGTFILTGGTGKRVEMKYALAGNSLTLTSAEKPETVTVRWSLDGNRFDCTSGGVRMTFFRRAPAARILKVWQEHNVVRGGRKGLAVHAHLQIDNAPGLPCLASAHFSDARLNKLKARTPAYSAVDGQAVALTPITPLYDRTEVKDLTIFLPYDELTVGPGKHDLHFQVGVYCKRDKRYLNPAPVRGSFTLTSGGT